jgi:hypothetical protein
MQLPTRFLIAPLFTVLLAAIAPQRLHAEVVQLQPQLSNDPIQLQGTSGGLQKSDCGSISEQPSQTLEVSQQFPYLRLRVESAGEPTLLIEGPTGRFCVLADSTAGEQPEMSGLWTVGTYQIYIGDLAGEQHSYTLSISEKPN